HTDDLAFEIAVNDAARVREGDCFADDNECIQQCREFKRIDLAGTPFSVMGSGSVGEGPAVYETHGIKWPSGIRSPRHFIHRHNARMLQLAGYLRFPKKPGELHGIVRLLRSKLF